MESSSARIAASTAPFELGLGGFGAFPTLRRPRVIWLGVEATPELRCLKQDLEWALADCGYDAETRDFHPHLTLGRADPGDGAGAFRDLDALVAGLEFSSRVSLHSLELMRSQLARDGAHYSVALSAKFQRA